jgi:hypothetical protein
VWRNLHFISLLTPSPGQDQPTVLVFASVRDLPEAGVPGALRHRWGGPLARRPEALNADLFRGEAELHDQVSSGVGEGG